MSSILKNPYISLKQQAEFFQTKIWMKYSERGMDEIKWLGFSSFDGFMFWRMMKQFVLVQACSLPDYSL